MKFDTFKPMWEKLNVTPRRGLWIAGGAAVVLSAAIFASFGTAGAADAPARKALNTGGVQVTEDANNYTVTLPESNGQGVGLRMQGHTLRIASNDSSSGVRLEQSLSLPDADATTQSLQISQQNGQVVVTVPKLAQGAVSAVPATKAPRVSHNIQPTIGGVPQDVFAQMRQMQKQMAAMMSQTMGGANGGNMSMPDPLAAMNGMSQFGGAGGSFHIEDKEGSYVVRAKLPGASADNVKVTVDNDRLLKISAEDQQSGGNHYRTASFTQMLTLPGPVRAEQIKVQNENGDLVITLPKA